MGEARLSSFVNIRNRNHGLRNTIIDFFDDAIKGGYEYITKIDNDCVVPKNWLNDMVSIIQESGADIISPDVSETNAARKYGDIIHREGRFIPSKIVGGLWFMKIEVIKDMFFEKVPEGKGIRAAFNIINQLVTEKDPKIGWTDAVTYGDVGHWLGTHKAHIKSLDHARYSQEIGRRIAWNPKEQENVKS